MTEIGSVLGGRYRLVELLGQGGMATIYRARDAQLDRDVAVKLLRTEFGRDPDFLARFRDEARAAASLNHPNIVAVFDFGEEDSGPYIVMELIDGQDLASILRENGPLPPRQAARVSAEVAKALHAAHVRGIVHRDVKPSNILVGRDGRVKVADFGIARALAESQITLPGTTMGSVHYFSPEQARGEPATQASDIYALGIVLYECLTGQRPFSGDGAAAVALARLTTTPPRPSALRAAVPAGPGPDRPARRWRSTRPHRYASAAAMASALEGWLADPAAAAAPRRGRPRRVPRSGRGDRRLAQARAQPPSRTRPTPTRAAPACAGPPPRHAAAAPAGRRRRRRRRLRALGVGRRPAGLAHPLDRRGSSLPDAHRRWRRIASPSPSASVAMVTLPSFVDMTYTDAEVEAEDLGLT